MSIRATQHGMARYGPLCHRVVPPQYIVPDCRLRHGKLGRFPCWTGPNSTGPVVYQAGPKPVECKQRERWEGEAERAAGSFSSYGRWRRPRCARPRGVRRRIWQQVSHSREEVRHRARKPVARSKGGGHRRRSSPLEADGWCRG
jgi:hypothetical protein